MPVPQPESGVAPGDHSFLLGAAEPWGRDATPCPAHHGSRGQQGAAVVLHCAVPQPPQGTVSSLMALAGPVPAGQPSPGRRNALEECFHLFFFLPETKEILAVITKSQNACAYLSATQPSRLSL